MQENIWYELYQNAVEVCDYKKMSNFMEVGSVGAAVLTNKNNIYTGVSVDTACSIGYCAERNAIGNMITSKEDTVTKLVAVKDKEIIMPCGVCREFMMQLGKENKQMEILVSLSPIKTIRLSELIPNYWA